MARTIDGWTIPEEDFAPRSIKQVLRDAGSPLGGAIRADWAKDLDDALLAYWTSVVETHTIEDAVCILYNLVRKDPSFRTPYWLDCRFRAHRRGILETFS